MNEIRIFEQEIEKQISACGSEFSLKELISILRENKEEIIKDEISFNGEVGVSFWDYISDEIVSIIIVYKPEKVNIYIFNASVAEVNPYLEELSMCEVTKLEELLLVKFNINEPSVSINRMLGESWLSS